MDVFVSLGRNHCAEEARKQLCGAVRPLLSSHWLGSAGFRALLVFKRSCEGTGRVVIERRARTPELAAVSPKRESGACDTWTTQRAAMQGGLGTATATANRSVPRVQHNNGGAHLEDGVGQALVEAADAPLLVERGHRLARPRAVTVLVVHRSAQPHERQHLGAGVGGMGCVSGVRRTA